MASVRELLDQRAGRTTRPVDYEELLLEPIVDAGTPQTTTFGSYLGWQSHHNQARRFYVAGMNWFEQIVGVKQTTLFLYRQEAHKRVFDQTNWASMGPKDLWDKALGQPQIRHAYLFQPVPFSKAAQVLMACELAIEDMLKKGGTLPPEITSPESIHGFMGIMPACSNIDDFSKDYIAAVKNVHGEPYAALRQAASLRSTVALIDLTKGFTVTRQTAIKIHQHCEEHFKGVEIPLGPVRGKPGSFLGSGNATIHEQVELE